MRFRTKIAAALLAVAALPAAVYAATIGGTYYAVQYDYREFFAATDRKNFQVVIHGNPFPGTDPAIVARDLLPMMQAASPGPRLTFTYETPAEKPRPDYRLMLVFDPAKQLLRKPRGQEHMQEVGVFAQRTKYRPNPLAITAVQLLGIEGNVVKVRGLDALDGTPVLDIKPYMPPFDRMENVKTPPWMELFMDGYF